MMFLLDLAFAAELIALGVGVALLVFAFRHEGAGIKLARGFGYIITLAAILSAACTTTYGVSYWSKGYFQLPDQKKTMQNGDDSGVYFRWGGFSR